MLFDLEDGATHNVCLVLKRINELYANAVGKRVYPALINSSFSVFVRLII